MDSQTKTIKKIILQCFCENTMVLVTHSLDRNLGTLQNPALEAQSLTRFFICTDENYQE